MGRLSTNMFSEYYAKTNTHSAKIKVSVVYRKAANLTGITVFI